MGIETGFVSWIDTLCYSRPDRVVFGRVVGGLWNYVQERPLKVQCLLSSSEEALKVRMLRAKQSWRPSS